VREGLRRMVEGYISSDSAMPAAGVAEPADYRG
jgi:hypothetical protein